MNSLLLPCMCPLRHPYFQSGTLHPLAMCTQLSHSPHLRLSQLEKERVVIQLWVAKHNQQSPDRSRVSWLVSWNQMSLFILLQYTHVQHSLIRDGESVVCVKLCICTSLGNTCSASLSLCDRFSLIWVVVRRLSVITTGARMSIHNSYLKFMKLFFGMCLLNHAILVPHPYLNLFEVY